MKINTLKHEIYDVLVIGGGASGIFASSTANFFDMKTILIEQKPYLGGQPMELYPNKYIYDFPCFPKIKSSNVIKMLVEQLNQYDTEILLDTQIRDIEQKEINNDCLYEVKTVCNKCFFAKNIIIASGNGSFNPKKLEINGSIFDEENIHYSVNKSIDIYRNKNIVVLGGGDSAVDWANYFVEENISKNVTIVHRRNQYRCSSIMIEELKKNNITEKLNYEVVDVDTNKNKIMIKNNETGDIETIEYDYLIVQYGQTPVPFNIDLFNKINKDKNKFVVDISQKTNLKHIYAVGDAIIYEYKANTIVTGCAESTKAIWHISKNKSRKW